MAYHILSIDGGGVYGMLSITVIDRLEKEKSFLGDVDLFAGTSIGGGLALGLAAGNTPEGIVKWFQEKAQDVFQSCWMRRAASKVGLCAYHTSRIKEVFDDAFGDLRLMDLKKHVLIPTYDLNGTSCGYQTWKPKFFHNFPGPDSDGQERVADVAWRSCAAPIYFPTAGRFADGSLAANNPAMAAICQTQDPRAQMENRPLLSDLRVLSLGKNTDGGFIEGENHDWGFLEWAVPLVNIVRQLDDNIVDYQVRQLLRDNYCRISPLLSNPSSLDDYTALGSIADVGMALDLSKPLSWLKTNW